VSGGILPGAGALSSEPAAGPPLAFAVAYAVNGLAAGGATKVSRVAERLQGWLKAPGSVAQGMGQKNVCCVTTRGRNIRIGECLWQRSSTLTAHTFGLGVLGFGRLVLASSGLPPSRLPAAQLAAAFGVLAVPLVPASWQVAVPTTFAQANPEPRSSRPSPAGGRGIRMRGAHGSVTLPRDSPGRMCKRSPRALINTGDPEVIDQSILLFMNETGKETF
jgi:hypothetical protein